MNIVKKPPIHLFSVILRSYRNVAKLFVCIYNHFWRLSRELLFLQFLW